ncbi:YfhO family protein [Caldilinea sp.]|uniref:YfhO family protein n=1 Tax=Caldilinea sp. TaxID=2293560 RepID=UPI002C80ADC1|nr:YfhO family protein [Caldilinea sp.]HRA67669.1 YfhO family protein [Caldilinea sp.]
MTLIWSALLIFIWLVVMGQLYRRDRDRQPAHGLWMDVLAGGLLWGLVFGFFWRTLSGAAYQPADGGDLVSFLFPTYRFAAAELAQGWLPLWNPTLYGGAPFIGDIQAGFLYPPHLALFLINPNFPYATLQGLAVGHLFWAGLGMYVLLRTLRWPEQPVSRPAAFFAAVTFAFADPLLIHFGNLNLIAVLSWLPWVLAAFVRGLQTSRWLWPGVAGLLFAVSSYAGHAQSTLYIGLALVILTIGWMITAAYEVRPAGARPWQPLGMLLATALLTALLAAPILLPALELTRYATRAEFTYQDTVAYSLAPTQMLAGLVTPSLFGRGPALHWSLWERVELPYLGATALIAAFCGIVLALPAQRRRLWMWVGMASFGLIVALGVYTVVHGWLTLLLPMFDQFRAPARAIILWTLGMSVTAAVGFDAVAVRAARANVVTAFLKGGAALLALGVIIAYTLLFVMQADATVFLRASLAALALAIAVVAWLGAWSLIAARQHRRLTFGAFSILMIALLYIELAAAGAYTDISETDPTQGFQHDDVITFLRGDADLFRIDTRTDLQGLWQPDAAALAGLQDVGGIDNPLALRSYAAFWEATGGRATRLYDMLNVKYVLVKEGAPLPEGKFEKVFGPAQGIEVYANRRFLPRAWVAPADADLDNLLPPDAVAPAEVTAYAPTRMSFTTTTPHPGWLIMSEFWYPGWTATVNGVATEIEQVNGALRAVAVPAGASTVTLTYWPSTLTWGFLAAAAGIVFLAFLTLWLRPKSTSTGSA